MAENPVAQAAREIAEPLLAEMGLELVEAEFVKEGKSWMLNIYIDRPGGVDLDTCEAVSRRLDPLFDADPRIAGRHDMLSVSSPGLDRPLKTDADLRRALHTEIEVRLYSAVDRKKRFEGFLEDFTGETVRLDIQGKPLELERKNIASAKYVVRF